MLTLVVFSGKIPACSVQRPWASEVATNAASSCRPTPRPRAAPATYTLTSATPPYTQRPDTGDRAAQPSTRPLPP